MVVLEGKEVFFLSRTSNFEKKKQKEQRNDFEGPLPHEDN